MNKLYTFQEKNNLTVKNNSTSTQQADWEDLFPLLKQQSSDIIDKIKHLTLPVNTVAFHQGDICKNYLLVIKGSIKVFARNTSGREIILYRVQRGASCVLTTSCLLGKNHYPAEGVTETEVQVLAIPIKSFQKGLAESESFRTFIFNTYATRLTEIISLIESISFEHINQRLSRYLCNTLQNKLHTTHQTIATELGSAREVISRQLKQFEQQGWIKQQRGEIEIINKEALTKIAELSN